MQSSLYVVSLIMEREWPFVVRYSILNGILSFKIQLFVVKIVFNDKISIVNDTNYILNVNLLFKIADKILNMFFVF